MVWRELNRKAENKSEMPFGSAHAGEISDATKSRICSMVMNTHKKSIADWLK